MEGVGRCIGSASMNVVLREEIDWSGDGDSNLLEIEEGD